jgi:hypothetical protein
MRQRGFRPIRRGSSPNIPPALQRAHRLMANGNYPAAAEAFEGLAQRAEARGGPRAPNFYLQAGRARILAGQTEVGVNHLKHGLEMFAAASRWPNLSRAGNRMVNELNQRGLSQQAQEIADYLKSTLPTGFEAEAGTASGAATLSLPTNCPGCGGPLRPDDVEWLDRNTAECPYCGSSIRAEA